MKRIVLGTIGVLFSLSSIAQLENHLKNRNGEERTFFRVTNNNSQNGGLLMGIRGGNANNGNPGFIKLRENRHLFFSTNNIERVRILRTGQFGIGTPAPTEQLDVNGNARFRSIILGSNDFITTHDSTGTLHQIPFTGDNNDVLLGDGTFAPMSGGDGPDLDWQIAGDNMYAIPTGNVSVGSLPSGVIKFSATDNTDVVRAAGSFRKVASAGQIGVPLGLQASVNDHHGFGSGANFVANSDEPLSNSTGVVGIAVSDGGNSVIAIAGNTVGSVANLSVGVRGVATAASPVQYAMEANSGAGPSNAVNFNVGIRTNAFGNNVATNSSNYGVFATANYGTATTTNVGVLGRALFPPSGVFATPNVNYGILGFADNSGVVNRAGFFNGDLEYTGILVCPSDAKLKNKMEMLDEGVMDLIGQLVPRSYEFRHDIPDFNLPKGKQYGFIAEEIESVMPECVYQSARPEVLDDKGEVLYEEFKYKSVSYMGLIPILTKAIQEQQEMIEAQDIEIEKLKNSKSGKSADSDNEIQELKREMEILKELIAEKDDAMNINTIEMWLDGEGKAIFLGQNEPNPFQETTSISYFIPDNIQNARIEIYDLAGKLLKREALASGKGIVKVHAANLNNGTLTYTIIADGEVVVSKKMLLAK